MLRSFLSNDVRLTATFGFTGSGLANVNPILEIRLGVADRDVLHSLSPKGFFERP